MSVDPGKAALKTGVVQGPPGAGKSSFVKHYAYKWSKPTEGEEKDEQKMWDLVLVLPVSTLRVSKDKSTKDQILQAIEQCLTGKDIEAIMENVDSACMKVLLIPDGLDECRSDTTLEMLRLLVEQSHKNILPYSVLVTCRTGLCPIDQSYFDRRMKIEGFTIQQGIEFVKRYYENIQKPEDESLFDYISNSSGTLHDILTNPLMTLVLSMVTADGSLRLKRGNKLGMKELLSALEESIKRRQLEKDAKAQGLGTQKGNDANLEVQTRRFYMMCLYSLLKDIRAFSDILLQTFSIPNTDPYFAFMKRIQTYSKTFKKVMAWQFTHEMFHEYFAACAIQALPENTLRYILLILCSSPKFRNTQRILFSSFGEDQQHSETLTDVMKAIILLQGGQHITRLQEKVNAFQHSGDPFKILLPKGWGKSKNEATLQRDEASTTIEIWENIKSHFTRKVKTDLFIQCISNKDLMSHIFNCLQEVHEEMQRNIFQNSIGCLLPWKQ